jgi:hypothetical protein
MGACNLAQVYVQHAHSIVGVVYDFASCQVALSD